MLFMKNYYTLKLSCRVLNKKYQMINIVFLATNVLNNVFKKAKKYFISPKTILVFF